MLIVAQHEITDPVAFSAAMHETYAGLPSSVALVHVFISTDRTQGVCLYTARSVDAVRRVVEEGMGHCTTNQFFEAPWAKPQIPFDADSPRHDQHPH